MIRKAILPVAGFGTRFLPATKAQPKEMLTLVDKPVIQYIVEEAVASGIKEIIFITGHSKRSIEDHFDSNFELEYRLKQSKKLIPLREIKKISRLARFAYVRQQNPKGDGDAVLQALHLVGNEPCAVLFGDDIVDNPTPCLQQMIRVFEKYNDPIIAVKRVPKKDVSSYGIVDTVKIEKRIYQISSLVEKPSPQKAPSNLAIIGKYIITPPIFQALKTAHTSNGNEIRLIDAFREVVKKIPLYAYEFEGARYDCGNKLGFLKATVDFALKHKTLKKPFKQYLKNKLLRSRK